MPRIVVLVVVLLTAIVWRGALAAESGAFTLSGGGSVKPRLPGQTCPKAGCWCRFVVQQVPARGCLVWETRFDDVAVVELDAERSMTFTTSEPRLVSLGLPFSLCGIDMRCEVRSARKGVVGSIPCPESARPGFLKDGGFGLVGGLPDGGSFSCD